MAYNEETGHEVAETTTAPEQPVAEDNQDMPTSKSTRSPAFQFYPKDFLLSRRVRRMSLAERGAYITLLSMHWLDGGLPTDLNQIASDLAMPAARFRYMWENGPLHECFVEKNGRLMNPRLEEEKRKQTDYRSKQRNAALMRWDKPADASQMPPAMVSSSSPISSSVSTASQRTKESVEPHGGSTPAVITFPTVGKCSSWVLTQGRIDGWKQSYPNLDVDGECRRASEWIAANPERRKTAKGMPAFLVNWMNRAVDRGGGRGTVAQGNVPGWVQRARAARS